MKMKASGERVCMCPQGTLREIDVAQIMQGEHGVSEEIELPPKKYLDQFDRLELDFELGCPGMICHYSMLFL